MLPRVNPDETIRSAREGTLSPLLANCIAAYAVRFVSDTLTYNGTYIQLIEGFQMKFDTSRDVVTSLESRMLKQPR